MKKIIIIINIIILSFTLFSCGRNKDEILYKDEVIEFAYSLDLVAKNTFLFDWDGIISRPKTRNIFEFFSKNLSDFDFYEATIVEKKVIAGFYDEKNIEKIHELCREYYDYPLDFIFSDEMRDGGYSDIYIQLHDCYSKNEPGFSLKNFDVDLYVFDGGIPLEYNDSKLAFVIKYYGIELNNGRIIVAIDYCSGDVIDNYFYPFVRNDIKAEPLNYGNYIYFEEEYANVIDYAYFSYNIFPEDGPLEYSISPYDVFEEETRNLFNCIKGALRDDTPNKDYDSSSVYYFDYQKLKDILVK